MGRREQGTQRAIGVDEERDAPGVVRVGIVRISLDAIDPPDGPIDVAQQRVAKTVLLGEDPVLLLGVKARAEDPCAERFELWASVTEALAFTRSAPGRGRREPTA